MTNVRQWEKALECGEDAHQWVEGQPPMMGEGGFPGRMGGGPMMNKDSNSADSQKKAAEAKEKKIKKILTKNSTKSGRLNKMPHGKGCSKKNAQR